MKEWLKRGLRVYIIASLVILILAIISQSLKLLMFGGNFYDYLVLLLPKLILYSFLTALPIGIIVIIIFFFKNRK